MATERAYSLILALYLHHTYALVPSSSANKPLFPSQVYESIQNAKIAVIPNFLDRNTVATLRKDAQECVSSFDTDALSGYGSSGTFDPTRDRTVLKLDRWKNTALGDWSVRQRFGAQMAAVRSDLARELNRPQLAQGVAASNRYGNGSTEISYTRFGPGAFLKRHVDEHHEELKGRAGWQQPTRRSVSWLVYLNEDWHGERDGGQLRCFERKATLASTRIGARNGDLQVAWLKPSTLDPVERPVFLEGHGGDSCRMYMVNDGGLKEYISTHFDAHPILYVAGSEALARRLLVNHKDIADRLHLIEPPKSKFGDFMNGDAQYLGQGRPAFEDEELLDVDPMGGTLVLFDSVSLPHEVLATKKRERWATSGWFHEDQQSIA